jgi:5-oxoprolinase (ATP-hydrolysing)
MSRDRADKWAFHIDVGGTFTDCIGIAPDGSRLSCKVLSSGVIKGAGQWVGAKSLQDETKRNAPADFYVGYTMRVGEVAHAVQAFDAATGTFTLSDGPEEGSVGDGGSYELTSGEEAPVVGLRLLRGLTLDEAIGPVIVRLGTTRGTNALLERKGADVAFVTTRGFGDLPVIGNQARPDLFALTVRKPAPLHSRTLEIDERVAADGSILQSLDREAATAALQQLRDDGIDAIAICLINAYRNPAHEKALAEVAAEIGFSQISVSTQLSRTIKAIDRADTTIVDAYLSPVIRSYVATIRTSMPEADLMLMTSAGGLTRPETFSGRDSILSGPAGGVIGCAALTNGAGFERALAFDMGGTSTDVSRYDGQFDYEFSGTKAGVRVVTPMLAIETVAAGGGSVCAFDGQRLTVGPESGGADPGPACYGRGGPLTVTDINLFMERLDTRHFPFPLDYDAVVERLEAVARRVRESGGPAYTLDQLAAGFSRVADELMAAAIRQISAARGYDPADYLLVSFGGAAAQHACSIAAHLGVGRILVHPLAGVLSAHGIGVADVRKFAERTVLRLYDAAALAELESVFGELASGLRAAVVSEGVAEEQIGEARRMLDLRYVGEESTICVEPGTDGDYADAFAKLHEQLYGHRHEGRDIEVVNLRVEVVGRTVTEALPEHPVNWRFPQSAEHRRVLFDDARLPTPVFERSDLQPGDRIDGPAIVFEPFSAVLVSPGWCLTVTGRDEMLLNRIQAGTDRESSSGPMHLGTDAGRDPIMLELFSNRITTIATRMGVTLQRSSLSVNVKERLDFSCAVLDANGELVVNAPHIPVHLGAMGETVKALLRSVDDIRPGDVFVCNDPDLGGSHLPDITVMTPVFSDDGELHFFTASRAHHAEIGGVRPGSCYPFATSLAEEGVVLRNLRVVRDGEFAESRLRQALAAGDYPSRSPDENVADIRAAIAANHIGATELKTLVSELGWETVRDYMGFICDAAEEKVRTAIQAIDDGEYHFEDALDDGAPICVTVTVTGEAMCVDFAGSGGVNGNSLNANFAIVQSALLYCLRCLIDDDIPLNAGVLKPVDLRVPEGMLRPPAAASPGDRAAVVGGNVEVSQRVVDVIFGALGAAAGSQGTMNNFVFGNDRFGYYETICGGAGATASGPGASAVHTHMTNTRITDCEVFESRYPVRLRQFAVRQGSGGAGLNAGGDGVIREVEFLEELEVSLLTQRRTRPPYGAAGGEPGRCGINRLRRAGSDADETLESLAQVSIQAGDRLTIETPGGGGWGGEAV